MRVVASSVLLAAFTLAGWSQGPPPAARPPVSAASSPAVPAAAVAAATPKLSLAERADILMARKRYYAAVDLLQQGLQASPRDSTLANRLGVSYQLLGNQHDATNFYKQAIHLNKRFADPYNNLGTIYFERGNFGKSLKYYKKAIHLKPTQATFFVNAGTAEFMRKKLQNARRDYLEALRLDPTALDPTMHGGSVIQDRSVRDPAEYHFFLARLYCMVGDLDDAMHQLHQASDLHYKHLKRVFTDPAFKPLLTRQDFKQLMAPPPPAPTAASSAAPGC